MEENIKLKKQVIAAILSAILSAILLINPIFSLSKYFKNKIKNTSSTTPSIENNDTTTKKSYFDLIDEAIPKAEIDFENLTIPTNNSSCTYTNNIISNDNLYNQVTELISIIKKNSLDYINTNPIYFLGFTNFEDTEKENNTDQIMIQSIFRDALSDILIDSTSKDLCVLKNLKVVISYSTENNNCIECRKEDYLIIIYPNNNWDEIEYSIRLELNKIRIDNCNCQNEPLFSYNTLNNASIVSELYNTNKTDIFVSNDDIEKETLFLSLGLFHDNYTVNDYYKAIFNNNIDALYKFCGATNEEDIYKINKILYAMDNNIDPLDYDYKAEIFSIIINNLINYTTNNKNFTLKENLTIFNTLRNIFNCKYIDELCNIYINFLSNHYETNINNIINILNDKEITNYTIALYNICNQFEKSGNVSTFDLSFSNKLITKFPLLKQILIQSIYQDYNNNLSNPYTLLKKKNS